MKLRTGMGILLASLVGTGLSLGGYTAATAYNTVPLVQQITAAGYPIGELSQPLCGKELSDCGKGTITTTNKDIVGITYRPAESPKDCGYELRRLPAGFLHRSSWEFRFHFNEADGIEPRLASTSNHIGGKGPGWTATNEFGSRSVGIEKPSPQQLWAFAVAHLDGASPKCKPTGA